MRKNEVPGQPPPSAGRPPCAAGRKGGRMPGDDVAAGRPRLRIIRVAVASGVRNAAGRMTPVEKPKRARQRIEHRLTFESSENRPFDV
jgi:hypothetical protein